MSNSTQPEKVYVAVGNDFQDGLGTLEWALINWNSHSNSIVVVHVNNTSKDFVQTPFGKLPASSVSDEKLEIVRMCEQERIDKLLSKYISICGKAAKVETLKIGRSEEPIHEVIVGLISRLRVTKLVMGIALMKSSSRRGRSAISGSFYVHKHKPDFCELYIICGGKLVFLKEENEEGNLEDDQGIAVANYKMKEKGSFKLWLRKMFTDRSTSLQISSIPTIESPESSDRWEKYVEDIEKYFQLLLSTSNLDEKDGGEEDGSSPQFSPPEPEKLEDNCSNMSVSDKIEALSIKIDETRKTIEVKRKEAKENSERRSKAEWAICLCNQRVKELESRINEEISNRIDLKKNLDTAEEHLYEVSNDIEKSKRRLNGVLELQSELADKLKISSLAKSNTKTHLENAVNLRAKMLQEIDALRRERDILRRRIEFCKERDAIVTANMPNGLNYSYREFTVDEIRSATDDFSERLRLKSCGIPMNVYRGRLNHTAVAIKQPNSLISGLSQEDFQAKMQLLSHIRHPHLTAMIGVCPEQKSIVFEYMHNGNLQDILFSTQKGNQALHWHARIRIATEVCSGLGFLHSAEPRPIIHGDLSPSNILLDLHLVAKITCYQLTECYDEMELRSDFSGLGMLMLQLLTGRSGVGLVEEVAVAMVGGSIVEVVDEMAGQWPLDLAAEFARIAMRCVHVSEWRSTELSTATVMRELDYIRKKAAEVVERERCAVAIKGVDRDEYCCDVPSAFVCPIIQDVMKNPQIAADGFSYELEAIEEWLGMGHDTSPMINLRLKHKHLTPNHTLRSLINEWREKNSSPPL